LLIARRFKAGPIFIPSVSRRSITANRSEAILGQLSFPARAFGMTQLTRPAT
jgi:hypothetical protein